MKHALTAVYKLGDSKAAMVENEFRSWNAEDTRRDTGRMHECGGLR
jgi:hypothetical protein